MTRRHIVDFFGCTGLYADGLAAAGWDVTCVDNDPRALAHNPHRAILGDAMKLMSDRGFMAQFDAAAASPPCQSSSATRKLADAQGKGLGRAKDELILPTIDALTRSGLPFVVENVNRSILRTMPNVARLCGSSFGLEVERHRLFLGGNGFTPTGTKCDHSRFPIDPERGKPRPWGVYYTKGDRIPDGGRTVDTLEHGLEAMGVTRRVPWKYLCEGLPPAYGRTIGAQLLAHVEQTVPLWDVCRYCGTQLERKPTGRPAQYCGPRCRVAAHRARKVPA